MATDDVAVIGAGPYGLSAAAHLRAAGVQTRIFGEPMGFWGAHMPVGMCLRSPWGASHLADPKAALTLDAFQAARGAPISRPIPLADFVDYGHWFQRQAVREVDPRTVTMVEPREDGFNLLLSDGEAVTARRVVVATGLAQFSVRPAAFADVPPELASHTVDHRDLSIFAGQRVVVIGAGQSAIESAALLHEAGAEVEVVMRRPALPWLTRSARLHQIPLLGGLLYAPADVGPAGMSWIIQYPALFRRCPPSFQATLIARGARPGVATWVQPRVTDIPVTARCSVVSATPEQGRLRLRLTDQSERLVDHVLLATGYRIDAADYPFLPAAVGRAVRGPNGYPRLGHGLESAVPGLHFLGAAATESFGPLMRFVAGTQYSARALTNAVRRTAPQPQIAPALRSSE